MNDDLISRKAVMDYLREKQANVIIEKHKENPLTHEATIGMQYALDALMNFIITMPTAYDIDWVKDQLEKKSNSLSPKSVRFVFLKDAKETVDTGGIDEGVMRNENSECD